MKNHNVTEFLDLNIDVQLVIFEYLDLEDLTSVAETHGHFLYLAQDIYRRKFSKKVIGFIGFGASKAENELKNRMEINEFPMALNVLKHFGSFISSLEVSYSTNNKHIRDLYKCINFYCAKTLIEIKIDQHNTYNRDTFFGNMTKSFWKVERVSIRGHHNNFRSSTLSFRDLFPVMRHLSLTFVSYSHTNGLYQTFPKLEHLNVQVLEFHDPFRFSESNTKLLLKENTHIQNLTLVYFSRKFLKTVSELVPKLKYLEIINFQTRFTFGDINEEIRFKNVKKFKIDAAIHGMPRVTFVNLVEFHTEAFHGIGFRWIDFLEKHSHVKRFYVENGQVNKEELERLTRIQDLKLIDTSLLLSADIPDEIIANFVRKNANCSKIHLTMYKEPHSMKLATALIREELTNNWTINESEFEVTLKNEAIVLVEDNELEPMEEKITIFQKFTNFFTNLIK